MLRFRSLLLLLPLIVLTVFATPPAVSAHPAWGIVVSSRGIVYFSDLETVWKIDRDGKVSVFRQGVNGRHVHELSIDSQDNIYGPTTVYDATTQKYLIGVWKMTPDGKESELQPPVDSVMSGVSIWRDGAGNMYAIEQNNNLKQRTLLLKRTADGRVSTLAGGAYGYADGKGSTAKFSRVTATAFGPDGNIYLTDGTGVRRITLDGDVKTIAKDITARTSDDKPTLFGGNDKEIFGLAADAGGNVYVADAGNRRLVKIANDGKLGVVYRVDPPYFPTGVFATAGGDVYVLEFSYAPPGTTDKPRVRKISADGHNQIVISFLCPPNWQCGTDGELIQSRAQGIFASVNTRVMYFVLLLAASLTIAAFLFWRRNRKRSV